MLNASNKTIIASGFALLVFALVLLQVPFQNALSSGKLQSAQSIAASGTINAVGYRGKDGERVTFWCPAKFTPLGVWGTDIYTDDSSVCTAALHAGVITQDVGGMVTIEIRPGASSYTASTQNGILSRSWGSWVGSFTFVKGGESTAPATVATPTSKPPTCVLTATPNTVNSGEATTLSWTSEQATAAEWTKLNTGKDEIEPPSGTPDTNGSMKFTPPPVGVGLTYVPTITLKVTGPGGSVTCSTQVTVASSVQAGFGGNTFLQDTPNPTISGTASGVTRVRVVLHRDKYDGEKVYDSGLVRVANGKWSVTVTPALKAGSYFVFVYDNNDNTLANGGYIKVSDKADTGVKTISNSETAVAYRGSNGQSLEFTCAGGTSYGGVWGSGSYTDDSSICGAAVHAGAIGTTYGGKVTIKITAGQSSYTGSSKNGITSKSWGSPWHGSFEVVGGDASNICPPGKIGFYPNCTTVPAPTQEPVTQTCPDNMAGTYPNCYVYTQAPTCPTGTTGTYPNCSSTVMQAGIFHVGDRVRVTSTSNVRSIAGTAGAIYGSQSAGQMGSILGGPSTANGYTWWNVDFDNNPNGWVIENNLTLVTSANQTCPTGSVGTYPNCVYNTTVPSTPTPCPVGTTGSFPNCVPSSTTLGTACGEGQTGSYPVCFTAITSTSELEFEVGDRVKIVNNPQLTSLNDGYHYFLAKYAGYSGNGPYTGSLATVTNGPIIADGLGWYFIIIDPVNGYSRSGWVPQQFLENSSAAPLSGTTYPQSVVYPPSITDPHVSNYSQTTGFGISTGAPGDKYRYYCMPDVRPAVPSGSISMSQYRPYWPVYGGQNGIYSVDSDICASAVQAGIITSASGGDVLVELVAWQKPAGTSANGITSLSTQVTGPAYKIISLPIGQQSPARITNVSKTSGESPLSTTFTVTGIPVGQINAYSLQAFGPDGRSDSNWSIGSYQFDQKGQPSATTGTKTLTFRKPGTYTVKLNQVVVSGLTATNVTLDTKTVTVTMPPENMIINTNSMYPTWRNFTFTWLKAGTTYKFDDGVRGPVSIGSVSQNGGAISTSRTFQSGTYTVRLLRGTEEVVTKTLTIE